MAVRVRELTSEERERLEKRAHPRTGPLRGFAGLGGPGWPARWKVAAMARQV